MQVDLHPERIVVGRIRQTAYRPARALRRDGLPPSMTGGPVHRYEDSDPYTNVYSSSAEVFDAGDELGALEPVMPQVHRRLPPPRPGLRPYFTNADGDHYIDVATGAVIQFEHQLSDKGRKDLKAITDDLSNGLTIAALFLGVVGGLLIASIARGKGKK